MHRKMLTQSSCIAITGLAGHAFGSFKHKGLDWMWLRDHVPTLPAFKGMGIYVYGYATALFESRSHESLNDIAREFLTLLNELKRGEQKVRAIVPR